MIAAASERHLVIRRAEPGDQAFVASTMSEQLSRERYREANATVDRIFDTDRVRVLVATDAGRIVGWLAYVPMPRVRAVLFAYVRRSERLQGITRRLVDAAWPSGRGEFVHAGLRGASTRSLLQRYPAVEMTLEELL